MSRIEIRNPNHPGYSKMVDAAMYEAMKRAYLAVLPPEPPGLTIAEIRPRLEAALPDDLYPGGAKVGWWSKAVQMDLEAKGIVNRIKGSPLRLYHPGR
jgi:hypothetical protein